MGDELSIALDWQGPVTDHALLPDVRGIYAMTGRMYGGSSIQLLYVGIAENSLRERWRCPDHRDWLKRYVELLDASLYYTTTDSTRLDELESVLIYVHQPNQNSAKKNSSLPKQHYIIHNHGSKPQGMLEVIDTNYPWFGGITQQQAQS